MNFTVRQIAQLIGGEVEGADDLEINQFYKIEEGKTGGISFLANPKYESHIYNTDSTAVIVSVDFSPKQSIKPSLIKVKDPYGAFSVLLTEYEKLKQKTRSGIDDLAHINKLAEIGQGVYIGAFTYISEAVSIGEKTTIYPQVFVGENVKIGTNCILYSGVKIYADTVIGDNCTLHSGAVIGCDGFGFAPQEDGTFKTIPQLGNVILGNNVSVGANTTIDRATIGSTVIHNGVKLDNLVQVAHNVEVGANTVIAAQSGIAGSAKLGANCMIGGQVAITGHITVASGTKIGGKSGVIGNIKKEKTSVAGIPANNVRKYLKAQALLRKLPEMNNRIKELEDKYEH